jgi:hypothetical protein
VKKRFLIVIKLLWSTSSLANEPTIGVVAGLLLSSSTFFQFRFAVMTTRNPSSADAAIPASTPSASSNTARHHANAETESWNPSVADARRDDSTLSSSIPGNNDKMQDDDETVPQQLQQQQQQAHHKDKAKLKDDASSYSHQKENDSSLTNQNINLKKTRRNNNCFTNCYLDAQETTMPKRRMMMP